MLLQIIIAGFFLGLIGSLHCVGMCGPLAMALPVQHFSKRKKLLSISLYQIGRILAYSIVGLILGIAGRRIYLSGFQQWFSIIIGMLVIFLAIQYWYFRKAVKINFLNRFYNQVQKAMTFFLRSDQLKNFFLLGMANGLLPCGMVYIAIASALTTSSVFHSTVFMACFGAGTLPAMMAASYFGQLFKLSLRDNFKKVIPAYAGFIGVLLILRGLNLGIPFISPVLNHSFSHSISCH